MRQLKNSELSAVNGGNIINGALVSFASSYLLSESDYNPLLSVGIAAAMGVAAAFVTPVTPFVGAQILTSSLLGCGLSYLTYDATSSAK